MALLCHAVALGNKTNKQTKKTSVAVQERCRSVPLSLCAPSRSLLAPFPRSLLLNRTETLATRAMADRESSVALCHGGGVEKKKKDQSRNERAVSLCATGWR